MFSAINRYITCVQLARATLPAAENAPKTTLVEVLGDITALCHDQPLLRDELYAQLHKQTRNCPTRFAIQHPSSVCPCIFSHRKQCLRAAVGA